MDYRLGPELQRMREYRVLAAGSEEAESGEEYFTGNEQKGIYRRYRPTRSEREAPPSEGQPDNETEVNQTLDENQDMDVDTNTAEDRPGGVWSRLQSQ